MASTPTERRAVVGVDIPWPAVEGVIFRVRDFTPHVARHGEKVAAPPIPLPYGALLVDSPDLTEPIQMPVNHRVDYLNFWDIYGGVWPIGDDQELLVSYLPY